MLFEKSEIQSSEKLNGRRLAEAFESAHNRRTVKIYDKAAVARSRKYALGAVNPHSRILWAKLICSQIEKHLCRPESVNHKRRIFLVTLVDAACARDVGANVDFEPIKRRMKLGLRGFSHLGLIEPALYTNLQAGVRFAGKRCVFWHAHALVWGTTHRKLQRHLRAQRQQSRFLAIAENLKGTDVRRIQQGTLPQVMRYLLKSPHVAYRVARSDLLAPTGEPLITQDGEVKARFFQHKANLRPGERVTLFHALKNRTFYDLTIAGGEGAAMLAQVKRDERKVEKSTRPSRTLKPKRHFRVSLVSKQKQRRYLAKRSE
jgi:hypothetical protein